MIFSRMLSESKGRLNEKMNMEAVEPLGSLYVANIWRVAGSSGDPIPILVIPLINN